MASPKSKASEDDDVILYMDEIRSNGLSPIERSTSRVDLADGTVGEPVVSTTTSIATVEVKPSSRHLETDNVNKHTLHPLHPDHYVERDVEEFDPEVHHRTREHHHPGIDDELLPDPDEEPTSIRPASPRTHPAMTIFGLSSTPPDINVYQQKKTIAQGMMDLALISANANQFRYVLQSSGRHPYYYPSLAMIGLSLLLQVVIGIGLIWNSRYNVTLDDQACKANRANNWTVIAIFLVTILNVFISSFGVVEASAIFPSDNAET